MSDSEFERLLAADEEVRAEGRTITGTVMAYGERAISRRERFAPGSIQLADTVHLDYEHDRSRVIAWTPGGGLELEDGDDAMRMRADVPPHLFGDHVLTEVREGRRTGLSVEFRAIQTRTENGIRVIEKALLRGVALLARPDYGASRVEARARARRVWL